MREVPLPQVFLNHRIFLGKKKAKKEVWTGNKHMLMTEGFSLRFGTFRTPPVSSSELASHDDASKYPFTKSKRHWVGGASAARYRAHLVKEKTRLNPKASAWSRFSMANVWS